MADIIPVQKSWISKPEGKVGAVVPIVAAIGGGIALVYTWGSIVPWIISMLQNTLTAAALAAGVAAIVVVVTDKRWRNLLFYGYKSLMRGLTGLFIEIDPIGILKTYVYSLRKNLEEMGESISNLNGQITKLKNQIDRNDADRIHSLEVAQQARKHGEDARNILVLQSRRAGRLEKSNMSLHNLYDRMTGLLRVLRKMHDAAEFLEKDIEDEVDVKSRERQALLAGYNAFTKAKKVMQGGGDEQDLFNMTMEHLTSDYGMKMGEIENFMEVSKAVIEGVDLDNGIYEEQAMTQLDAWEKKSSLLLGSADAPPALESSTPQSEFADLFQRKPDTSRNGIPRQ